MPDPRTIRKTWLLSVSGILLVLGISGTIIFGISIYEFHQLAQAGGTPDSDALMVLPFGLDIIQMSWILAENPNIEDIPTEFRVGNPADLANTVAIRFYSGLIISVLLLLSGAAIAYSLITNEHTT